MTDWYYQGKPFTSEDIGDHFAFVYQITDLHNDKLYIGKSLFWKPSTRRVKIKTGPNAGKSKSKKIRVESGWKNYYSSNKFISEAAIEDPSRFKREILILCAGRGEAAYLEAKLQFERNVLLDDRYYNGIINCRINQSAIQHLRDTPTQ